MLGGATIARPFTAAVTEARTAARSAPGFVVISIESSWPCRPGDVLRQRKWGKDIVSAVEVGELLAAEHVGDRDLARAELELLAFRVADGRSDLDAVRRPDSVPAAATTASFRAPPSSALLLSAPNSRRTAPRTRRRVGTDIRIIGAAAATPGTAATSAVIVSGNPASVMPDTSRAAMPATPSASRFTDPVIDPKMPNIATRYIADTAITAIEAIVRRRWTASSRRLNTRSRLAAAAIAEPGLSPGPPRSRRNRAGRPAV